MKSLNQNTWSCKGQLCKRGRNFGAHEPGSDADCALGCQDSMRNNMKLCDAWLTVDAWRMCIFYLNAHKECQGNLVTEDVFNEKF